MKPEKMQKLALGIIEQCHEEGTDVDNTKMQMLQEGIPFNRINSLYKGISIDLGYLIDPATVTDSINEALVEADLTEIDEWDAVQAFIEETASAVNGATEARVLTLLRIHCREEEIDLPKRKAKRKVRVSKCPAIIVDLVNDNNGATKQDAYDALIEEVNGNDKSATAIKYVNQLLAPALAVANVVSLKKATKGIASQTIETYETESEDE